MLGREKGAETMRGGASAVRREGRGEEGSATTRGERGEKGRAR